MDASYDFVNFYFWNIFSFLKGTFGLNAFDTHVTDTQLLINYAGLKENFFSSDYYIIITLY